MSGQDGGYGLGVDLGTSHTVAVLRWPDGRTRPLLFDGQPILPSGVFLDDSGRLHAGRDAQRLAQADPARYEPNPKRRIDEPAVLLGDREVPVVDLLASVLRTVAQAAVEAVGFLPPAVLTYPATWGARRRDALAAAVGRAGWPPVIPPATGTAQAGAGEPPPGQGTAFVGARTLLVPEPVAAARYFADVLRRPVPVGSALAVFDFGGGTLDIAVVRNEGTDSAGRARMAVIGSGGVADLGGLDLDAALVAHLGTVIAAAHGSAWQQLSQPGTASQWRNRRQFWDDVRGAKEMLSRTAVAPVPVPGVEQAVHLTRDELESLVLPLLRRGVHEAASVIASCRLAVDQLAGLFLVGGSSRVPLVARLLHAELGIAPTVLEQPELPVAEGALAELDVPPSAPTSPAGPADPGRAAALAGSVGTVPGAGPDTGAAEPAGTPTVRIGSSTRYAVGSAPIPRQRTGVETLPDGMLPVSGTPISPGHPGSPAGHPGSPSGHPGSPAGHPGLPPGHPGSPAPPGARAYPIGPAGAAAWWRRRAVWIGAGAIVALVGVVTAVTLYFTGRGYADLDFVPFEEIGRVNEAESRPGDVFTWVAGDRAYVAFRRGDNRLVIAAVQTSSAKQLWRISTDGASERWAGIRALPNALVTLAHVPSDSTPRELTVFDPADGRKRWSRLVHGDDTLHYFEQRIVLLDRTDDRLYGLNLTNGKQEWSHPVPKDQYDNADAAVYPVTTAEQFGGPAGQWGESLVANQGADPRIVRIGVDRSVQVIDVMSGKVVKERPNAAAPGDLALAYEGQLYVAGTEGGYSLRRYDLEKLDEPVNSYTATDPGRRAARLQPCGRDRVCLLETSGSDGAETELVAVRADGVGSDWRAKVPNAQQIVSVGEHVMTRGPASEPTTRLFTTEGSGVLSRPGVGARVDGGNLLFFAEDPSNFEDDASIAGVPVGSRKVVELGQLKGIRAASCTWNTEVMVCPAEKNFVFVRFVAAD